MSAPNPIPTIIAQGASAIYHPCKDLFLYVKGQRQDIKDLEDRIGKLIIDHTLLKSEKERIDTLLSHSVSTEESNAYKVMKDEVASIHNKYIKFINKYTKMTKNQLNSTTDQPDGFSIHKLADLKSDIMTFNFLKLAKLSRDIAKLSNRASEALSRLTPKYMIQKKAASNQEKFDDDDVLQLFNTYVDRVLEYLCEGNIVGILGCQGVGKTTVLRKVYNRLLKQESLSGDKDSPRLDYIIWIEYPPETEINIVEKLQNEIMEQLEIHHEASKTLTRNENTISTFLRNKKYILLMDHVSSVIHLEKLGLKEDHKHKKVVICSREKVVIRRMTEHEVEIQGLKDDEALMLFQIKCGASSDERKETIAKRIIDCCAGIPWMIRGVASYLKDKIDDDSWYGVKDILQSNSRSLDLLDLGGFDKVYEIKYKGLATETKKCLLYGMLFPHQYKIQTDYLIECWIAEGFIAEEANQKVRVNRGLGRIILNQLTDQYLLHWYASKKYVMMAPDFRRVASELDYPDDEKKCAIWVPSKDRNPDDNAWSRVTRMSLIGCNTELPQSPLCCNLCTLLLKSLNQKSGRIPDSFFIHMESLQVLDLNHTNIGGLPHSIDKLVNLKSLYLNGCFHLKALPCQAANLVKLEFFDISGTSIPTLPIEIGCMVKMRSLRASLSPSGNKVDEDDIIPPDIITNLTNLEELSIITDFDFGIAAAKRIAEELASLKHLNTLCFNFPNVSSLDTFVTNSMALTNIETKWTTHTLRSFKIFIGCEKTQRSYGPEFSTILSKRWLRYSSNEEFSPDCQVLLNQASTFEIIGHDGLESFTSSKFDLHQAKVCIVERCKKLKNIIDGYVTNEVQDFVKVSLLKNLEKLYLYDLDSLECIWHGHVPHTTLTNLTAITIKGCHKLTRVLDPALAHSLNSLEYLKVEDCHQITNIIEARGETSHEIVHVPEESSNSDLLTSLRKIELSNLPEMESICGNGSASSVSWYSLRSIIVMRCNKLSNLCLSLANAKKLASIQCEESWWNALIIPDEVRQHFLQVCCFKEEYSKSGGGEASTSGRSESINGNDAFHNHTVTGTDNHQAVNVLTDGSDRWDDDFKFIDDYQPNVGDPEWSGCSSYVT